MTENNQQKNIEPAVKTEIKKSPIELGLDQNLSAVLAYLFFALGGIVFYILEKENKFVRFAAMQSILFTVFIFALFFIWGIFAQTLSQMGGFISVAASLAGTLFIIGIIAVWGLLMFKAFNGKELELPIIGKMARDTIK